MSVFLSIVSPEYHGEKMVEELVRRIKESVVSITDDFEIILVNDASPDNTWDKIQKVCQEDTRVKGINLSRNFGQHYAISAGLKYAKGEWIIVLDCDLQDRPEEIPNLYAKAVEGYDIVYAQRAERKDGFLKKLSSSVFHFCYDWLSGQNTDKTIANFGIYHSSVIAEYNKMPETARSFGSLIKYLGFRHTAIPVIHAERPQGENVNLLKVSSHDEGVFASLLSAFEDLTYTTPDGYTIKGDDLLKTMGVIYFSRNAVKLGELMSKNADVRIAWGGREAVETVAGYPSKYDCETVIFGPKLSFAVVSKEMLTDEQAAKKLARRVSVDVSVFDQTGCASAHNLFIEKGGVITPERFCQILNESMGKTEIQIPKPTMSPEQVSAVHSIRGVYDFCGLSIGSETMSYSILLDDHNELHKPVYSRVLFVHAVDSIMQAIKHITEDIQTIGIEATPEQAIAFAEAATPMGAVRFPQIGRMLNFEMPWDGIVLIDRLVKWNTLLGPLA